jgi:peptidoglycan/LPS O-acetylase OafA/YrhL
MEIPDVIFSLTIIVLSAWIAYNWVIKPEREERRRRTEQLLTKMRHHRGKRSAKPGEQRHKPISAKS